MAGISSSKRLPKRIAFSSVVRTFLVVSLVIILGLFSWVNRIFLGPENGAASSLPCASNAMANYRGNAQAGNDEVMNDSTNATVMGMATGYPLKTYRHFVGSLRNSGFKGNIILVISENPGDGVEKYLAKKGVTIKKLKIVPCETQIFDKKYMKTSHDKEILTCADPYPYLKVRWGRFPILRDYLKACETCSGPVLVTDVRDALFQRDPFGDGAPKVTGLQVFEEFKLQRTTHWIVKGPVSKCKNLVLDETMLCSGTTIGTREAMLDYLEIMHQEMTDWMKDPKCCCNKMNGDDQSIHNYLFYTGRFPFASAIKNRMGIVNTVGRQASDIFRAHEAALKRDLGNDIDLNKVSRENSFPGTVKGKMPWIGPEYDMVDNEGFFLDYDGQRSRVVHQYDRFRDKIHPWLLSNGLSD